jgi:hypothetical protein
MIAVLLTINTPLVHAEAEEASKTGIIRGRVLLSSKKPMLDALVLFYAKENGPPPFPERYWRVPDAVVPVDSDGKFSAELEEGEYFVGAIGKESRKLVPGPPVEGDLLVFVKDMNGKPKVFSVKDGKKINIGTHMGFPYHKKPRDTNSKLTSIEGAVSKADGTPVSGAYVFAFHSSERGSKPVFASERADKNGKYFLRLSGEGTFYLRARDTYGGGKPQSGQVMGIYGGEEPAPISVSTGGRLQGIDIIVEQY